MVTWQRYTSVTARDRMSRGLCPECGQPGNVHTGGIGPCSLTDNGVAGRLFQYQLDETHMEQIRQAEAAAGRITLDDGESPHDHGWYEEN